jgi:cullin 1
MSYSYYILLYTAIYDFCTLNRPATGTFGAGGRGGPSLQGSELYKSLHTYLSSHCNAMKTVSCFIISNSCELIKYQETEKLSDLELLKSYAKQWDQYTTGANYVNKLFNYLNKHWVKREKEEGRKEVYTVYTVCLIIGYA